MANPDAIANQIAELQAAANDHVLSGEWDLQRLITIELLLDSLLRRYHEHLQAAANQAAAELLAFKASGDNDIAECCRLIGQQFGYDYRLVALNRNAY